MKRYVIPILCATCVVPFARAQPPHQPAETPLLKNSENRRESENPNNDSKAPWPAKLYRACERGVVLVAAHRGGYVNDRIDQAPENSLANLKLAIEKGYDVYETDIQRTSDGVFVIVHDPTLDRETNGKGAASELSLAELKRLKKRYRDGTLSDESVATLKELLTMGKGKILFKPDLKPGMMDHFREIAELIDSLGMNDQVLLRTKFGDLGAVTKHFENGCPRVEVMLKTKSAAQVKTVVERLHPKTIHVEVGKGLMISEAAKESIQIAVSAGVLVQVHTSRDSPPWKDLADLGVRMFHTTLPDRTLAFLELIGRRPSADDRSSVDRSPVE